MMGMATDTRRRTFLCRASPMRGNRDRRERRLAMDQRHGRAPMPPARAPEPDNNRRDNGGANANPDADAPPLFR
jgi:hypothetical protein